MDLQLTRYERNPILTPTDRPWESKFVFNCGVTVFQGDILLLYRAQGTDNISRFGVAILKNGTEISYRSPEPVFEPDPTSEYEVLGVEDPRIVVEGDTYYITYTAASHYPPIIHGPSEHPLSGLPGSDPWRVRISLAYTQDFKTFTRKGVVVPHIDSKDASLFPGTFEKQHVLMHRVYPNMRLAVSSDLQTFHERGTYVWTRPGMWDEDRVGAGAQPIKTPYGWLLFYHGVDHKYVYRLGLLVADLHDPSRLLARSTYPVLEPAKIFENKGNVPHVVFTCGAAELDEKFLVYYGAADSATALATIEKSKVYQWIEGELKKKQSPEVVAGIPHH